MKLFLPILLILSSLSGKGQRYHFEKITEQQGLSDNRITCFMQDRSGFMWIGTANGLNRYDGHEYRVYGPGNKVHRLSHEHINNIEQDADGRLWIATWGGLNVLDPDSDSLNTFLPDQDPLVQKKTKIASSLVWDTYIDQRKRVWLALDARDLCYYDPDAGEFHYYPWRAFIRDNLQTSLPNPYNAIQKIIRKSDHELWLGTTRGLFSFDIEKSSFTYYGGDNRVNTVFLSYDSLRKQVYFGQQELYLYQEASHTFSTLTRMQVPRSSTVMSLPLGLDLAGLWEMDVVTGRAYPIKIPGHFAPVNTVVQTGDTKWIGTSDGAYLYTPSLDRFRLVPVFPDTLRVTTGNVNHVLDVETPARYYVSSYAHHCLVIIDKKTGSQKVITHIDRKPLTHCTRTYEDSHHRLWILTERHIFVSDTAHERFTVFKHPQQPGPYLFNDMVEDSEGNFWFASLTYGIYQYHSGTGHWKAMHDKPDGLFSMRPTRLQADHARQLVWIADFGYGVFRYELQNHTFTNYGANTSDSRCLQSALATDLSIDRQGQVWVATNSGGVSRYSDADKKFRNFSMQTGLPENTVVAVQVDHEGDIWLASQKGITRMKPDGSIVKHFDPANGLPFSGFAAPWSVNAHGELLTGIANGFLKFHPDSLTVETTAFPVRITSAHLSGHSLLTAGVNDFAYDENEFAAQFAALTYIMPQKTRFFYRLEGFDSSWVAADNKPQVHYTNLAPGSYRFSVRAVDYTGRPSSNTASVAFIIDTPFWKRWWFIASLIAVAVVAIILWTRILQRRVRSQQILNQFATSLYNQGTYEEVFWTVAKNCIDLLHFEDCVIYLLQEDRGLLVQKAAGGPKNKEPFQIHNPIEIALGQGIVGTVGLTGKPEIVNNTKNDIRYLRDDAERLSEISVPILVEGKVFGVIDSEHSRSNFYTRWHLKMLTAVAAICSAKISRYFVEDQIRSRVARDLHDDMGSALSSINIMSKVALERHDATLSGSYLKSIRENTMIMQERLGDMVWAINPKNDSMERVIARMKEFAAEMLEPLNILYSFSEVGDLHLAKMDINTRKDFYLIFKEALNNAAKYSSCKNVFVQLTHQTSTIRLRIEDDGQGFDTNRLDSGNGLSNMKYRAKSIRAELRIQSTPGKGSVIHLTVPYR